MHAPSSDWVFLLHCHQFRKPLMEKINPDTQTSPLCLVTWRVIIAARDLHPANICSPSPNYGPPLPAAVGAGSPGGIAPPAAQTGELLGRGCRLFQPFPGMEISTQTRSRRATETGNRAVCERSVPAAARPRRRLLAPSANLARSEF